MDLYDRWRIARRFGTRRDAARDVLEALSDSWEKIWLCRVRGQHHEKMASHGACYRCGKAMR